MYNQEHIVKADNEGNFYCRAVNAVLNCRENQQVCGIGCPCYVSAADGCFVCKYEREETGKALSLFPSVAGLDKRLDKAYRYAADAHRRQYRKGTSIPYFTHIITTVNYCMELTDEVEIIQAAILHDTVEDTCVTLQDLRREFGGRVARIVEAETEDKRRDRPADETWEIRKQETISRLGNIQYDAKIVVLADKTANAEALFKEWQQMGDEVWNQFNMRDKKKQEWYFRSVAECLEEVSGTGVMKKLEEYIDRLFGREGQ
ncbi:MAG: HD domain-containing protein [Lachnospiraceae bacterium]|nr:HD domain-containing protein [Lachnospiraceae bacterium]